MFMWVMLPMMELRPMLLPFISGGISVSNSSSKTTCSDKLAWLPPAHSVYFLVAIIINKQIGWSHKKSRSGDMFIFWFDYAGKSATLQGSSQFHGQYLLEQGQKRRAKQLRKTGTENGTRRRGFQGAVTEQEGTCGTKTNQIISKLSGAR
jgi:hypothetical protein